jgi:hypothetical protein
MNGRNLSAVAMVALLLASAFAGPGVVAQSSDAEAGSTYSVQYTDSSGELQCVQVQTVSTDEDVRAHYDYRTPPLDEDGEPYDISSHLYSSYGTQERQVSQGSVMYLHEAPDGNTSLVMVHDKLDDEEGGAVSFEMSYGGDNLEWSVKDDDYDEEEAYGSAPTDVFATDGAGADWTWVENRTDGGALSDLDADGFESVTITPEFDDPRFDDRNDGEMESWTLYTSSDESVEIPMDSDVTVYQGTNCGESESGEEETEDTEKDEETEDTDEDGAADGSETDAESDDPVEAKAVSAVSVSETGSSAQIAAPPNGGTVAVPLPSGTTNGVTFDAADVGVSSRSLSFQFGSELSAEAGNMSAPNMSTWAYLDLTAEGDEAHTTTADVTFNVSKETLNASGAAVGNVSAMYYSDDGTWEQANATVVSEGEGAYTLTATVPATSSVAVGLPDDDGATAEDGDEATTSESDEATTSESDDSSSTDSGDESAAQQETQTESESGGESESGSGTTGSSAPGFGLALTVLAVAGSALLLVRHR